MRYEVELDGRTHVITVERAGARFQVEVDGQVRAVDAAALGGHGMSLLVGEGLFGAGGASYDISVIPEAARGRLSVQVNASVMTVGLNGLRHRSRKEDPSHGAGPQRVVAPMPGRVVRVLVAAGESVRARQPLIVVEAMKMENELRAPRDGRVAEITVTEGQPVEAGTLLAIVTDHQPQ